jgi:Cdc6-like AAA superfamily ATPase
MAEFDNQDPVALLHASMADSNEDFGLLERLRAQYAKSPRDKVLAESIDALLAAAVQREDLTLPAGFGNRAHGSGLVIMGPTGVGKSRAIERYFKKHPLLKEYKDPAASSPLISVSAPSPCTSMTLARSVLRESGYPIERDLPAHRLWELVWERMDMLKRFVLHLDELQHVVQHISDKERQEVANLLKHAMYGRRISLIISGVDALTPFLEFDPQLLRRLTIKRLAPLDAETIPDLERAVKDYVHAAGLTVDTGDLPERPDFYARLAHAGLNAFGYSIVVAHLAIECALKTGASVLNREHFATIFAMKTNSSADRNVFLADKWHEIDCTILFPKKDVPPPPAPARRKGSK